MIVRSIFGRLVFCGFATILAGCSVVGSSSIAPVRYASNQAPSCHSYLGSYTLPKQVIRFTITGSDQNGFNISNPRLEPIPDDPQRFSFCLDHLANPLADDRVLVRRSTKADSTDSTPFLQVIAANSTDQTVRIVRRVIRAVFDVLSQSGGLGRATDLGGQMPTVASHEVDPFDPVQMAEVNAAIREYGFCLVLEDFTYNIDAISANAYCQNPINAEARHPSPSAQAVAQQDFIATRPVNGVFYRPRRPYSLAIYTKRDPDGPGDWRLSHLETHMMENVSPIIGIGVDRAAFAQQRTALLFDNGTLDDVCISRGGQLAGLIEIPLEIVYGLVNLPSTRIVAAINSNNSRRDMIAAQTNLIKAQEEYIAYLQGRGDQPTSSPAGSSLNIGETDPSAGETTSIDDTSFELATLTDPSERINGGATTDTLFGGTSFQSICSPAARLPSGVDELTED